MNFQPKYCSECRASLVPRQVDDRLRHCCPGCGKVFYRNPLPVASALVLNEHKQVLLVQRAKNPHRGMWCLPIGFAELDETIEEAALRELKEEAGVMGAIGRLLDVHSAKSDYYGDLLIVTFEVSIVDGELNAGDDASDAEWFDLFKLPPLAFSANEAAISKCIASHRAEWAQEESFAHIGRVTHDHLLSYHLIQFVERNAETIINQWQDEVIQNAATPSYRRLDFNELSRRATTALEHLGNWLRGDVSQQEVEDFFFRLAGNRSANGIPPQELLVSLAILRQTIWAFCRTAIHTADPLSTYAALELNQRIVLFFDHAAIETSKALTVEFSNRDSTA